MNKLPDHLAEINHLHQPLVGIVLGCRVDATACPWHVCPPRDGQWNLDVRPRGRIGRSLGLASTFSSRRVSRRSILPPWRRSSTARCRARRSERPVGASEQPTCSPRASRAPPRVSQDLRPHQAGGGSQHLVPEHNGVGGGSDSRHACSRQNVAIDARESEPDNSPSRRSASLTAGLYSAASLGNRS